MTILITDPNYDDTTGYLHYYTKEIIEFVKNKGFDLIHLERPRLKKEEVSKLISMKKPFLLLFNGHGDGKTIYGDKINKIEEPLIKENSNHHLLENKLIYARSCYAALSLGKSAVKKGGCFIGYNAPFKFWIDITWCSNPSKDKLASLFLIPSNELMKSLIKGNPANKAAEKFCSISKKTILRLLAKEDEPGVLQAIKVLWSNMTGQVVLGDEHIRYSC